MSRWVMAVGENPLRVLRVAQVVQPVEVASDHDAGNPLFG